MSLFYDWAKICSSHFRNCSRKMKIRWHRCCWRMLETKCVGDNCEMFLVINIHYLFSLASGTNIHKMSPTSKFSHQHQKIVNKLKSPTSGWHQLDCHRLTSYKTNLARKDSFRIEPTCDDSEVKQGHFGVVQETKWSVLKMKLKFSIQVELGFKDDSAIIRFW